VEPRLGVEEKLMAMYERTKAKLMQDFPSIIKPDWKDSREYEKVITVTTAERRKKAPHVDSAYRNFRLICHSHVAM
jgi:hypothetical protein